MEIPDDVAIHVYTRIVMISGAIDNCYSGYVDRYQSSLDVHVHVPDPSSLQY
jgi:hypothetical protein